MGAWWRCMPLSISCLPTDIDQLPSHQGITASGDASDQPVSGCACVSVGTAAPQHVRLDWCVCFAVAVSVSTDVGCACSPTLLAQSSRSLMAGSAWRGARHRSSARGASLAGRGISFPLRREGEPSLGRAASTARKRAGGRSWGSCSTT